MLITVTTAVATAATTLKATNIGISTPFLV
jgi:hypothetical protein